MKTDSDLTRWNRAGLRKFRYIDGNAATYLEQMRAGLEQRFPQWQALSQIKPFSLPGIEDKDLQYLQRVLDQYHGQSKDWGFEIIRAFARAAHVLTEHINAYANEGYLHTATQWDHVRRLVEMLDYHPAPPSSASTLLVIEAKPGQRGIISTGFQVKHTPPQGGESIIFETLDDIEVDDRLNAMRLVGWDRSPAVFSPFACGAGGADSAWQTADLEDLSTGDVAVLVETSKLQQKFMPAMSEYGWPCSINTINPETGRLCIGPGPLYNAAIRGNTRLLTSADKVYVPHLNGDDVLKIDHEHGLDVGDVIAWQSGQQWQLNAVKQVEGDLLRLENDSLPLVNRVLYKTLRISFSQDGELRIPLNTQHFYYRNAGGAFANAAGFFKNENMDGVPVAKILDKSLSGAAFILEVFVLGANAATVGAVAAVGHTIYIVDGSPGELVSGDWVVGEGINNDGLSARWALQVERIEEYEKTFQLFLSGVSGQALLDETGIVDIDRQLKLIEIALDKEVFDALELDDLISKRVNDYPVTALQGVGEAIPGSGKSYSEKLNDAGIFSLGDMARQNLAQPISGISEVWWREFIIKAETVVSFKYNPVTMQAYNKTPLPAIRGLRSGLPGLVKKPLDFAERLKAALPAEHDIAELKRIYGPFTRTLYPQGYNTNPVPVDVSQGELTLDVPLLPDSLKSGRRLLLEQETAGGYSKPREVIIDAITGNTLKLTYPLIAGDGFTLGNTVVRGNVLIAGHGEAADEKVLGSGDATQLNQGFILNVQDLSFVADSTMPAGVRADIRVTVDGQTWQQVGSLRDSKPTDAHYTVRMNEGGDILVQFGDGLAHGRRLPSGDSNIRVAYRVGSGLAGNVPAGGLEKPVKPHKLVKAVRQPMPAGGGDDMEGVASLRSNAPASLLTLERAVSLEDFANLAVSQSGIWQARAFAGAMAMGRQESVQVVVVPAGGAELDEQLNTIVPDYVLEKQREFLLHHALPGVAIIVSPFEPVLIDMTITVRVKSAEFDPDDTKQAVRLALLSAFNLQKRKLGQALYRSELYKVVEAVRGVENSACVLSFTQRQGLDKPMIERPRFVNWETVGDKQVVRHVQPRDWQVVYSDTDYSTINISTEEYEL